MKALVALLLVCSLTTPALARHHKEGGRGMGKMMKELNLSKEQKAKMKELRKSKKSSVAPLQSEFKKAKEAFQNSWKNNASDSEIKNLHTAMHTAKMKMGDKMIDHRLAVRAILNEEQRKKFAEKMGRQKMKMGHSH